MSLFKLRPLPYTIPIFLVLVTLVFFVPYLRTEPVTGTDGIFTPGRYPLIYLFLMSAVVMMDVLWGNFILADWVWFLGFLAVFFALYLLARGLAFWVGPWLLSRRHRHDDDEEIAEHPRYVLDLADKRNDPKE